MRVFIILLVVVAAFAGIFFLIGPPPPPLPPPKHIQYNICILLDLSDRITKNNQVKNDLDIITGLAKLFKEQIKTKLTPYIKDKLRVRIAFQEGQVDPLLVSLADSLTINFDDEKLKNKKNLMNFDSNFIQNVKQIYSITQQKYFFTGADIWTFFRDNLRHYVESSSTQDSVRNVVIILTDGYLNFAKTIQQTRQREGNRTSYMEVGIFRNDPNWKQKFQNGNFGLISLDRSYENLEVIMLEVNPLFPMNTNEFSIICKYWSQWFEEMGITKNRYIILKTDIPSQTIKVVKDFLNIDKRKK
jgi:hypothetical protein